MQDEIPHQVKLSGLLWLRHLLKQKMIEEKGADFSWNSTAIRSLSKKIASVTGIHLSDRALRMTISEQITNKTVIPLKSHPRSRVDAISFYLGYKSFQAFCFAEKQTIVDLKVKCQRKVFQSHLMQNPEERLCYFLEGYGDECLTDIDTISISKSKNIVVYYYKNVGFVFRGLLQLNVLEETAELTTYVKPQFTSEGQNLTELYFKGHFKRHAIGYIEIHLRLTEKQWENDAFLLSVLLFVNNEALDYRFALGTYITRSMYHLGCYAGKVLFEFCEDEQTARKKYADKTDEKIEKYLKDTQIETEPMAFYTLDDLINYKPASCIVTL